jgi:molybdopterin-guanine dinucleotide biosynthesis protein
MEGPVLRIPENCNNDLRAVYAKNRQLSCKKQAGKTLRLHQQTPDTDVHKFSRQLKTIVRKKHDLAITRKRANTLRVLAQMYKSQ